MIILSQYICPLLLALSFLFSRAQGKIVIGYRAVDYTEARVTNEHKKPFIRKEPDETNNVHQLGPGYYLLNHIGEWPGNPYGPSWYCVVEADPYKMREVSKIWIPEFYVEEVEFAKYVERNLWDGDEETILRYIKSKLPNIDPRNALRFSYILRFGLNMQMVIPSSLLNMDVLDLRAECFETKDKLEGYIEEKDKPIKEYVKTLNKHREDIGVMDQLIEFTSKTLDWGKWPGIIGNAGEPSFEI